MRSVRAALLALAAAVPVACYGGPGTDSPVVTRQYPEGVDAAAPAPIPSGMYPASVFGAYSCCWLTKDASFAVKIPADRKQLRVMVSLPAFGPYDARPQRIVVQVDAQAPKTFAGLKSGIYALDVPLGPHGDQPRSIVRIGAGYEWQRTGDAHPLSVILRSVRGR